MAKEKKPSGQMIFPKWVKKTQFCIWCRQDQSMKLYHVRKIDKPEQGIEAWYICKNKECEHMIRNQKENIYGIRYTGGFIKAYDELKKAEENR